MLQNHLEDEMRANLRNPQAMPPKTEFSVDVQCGDGVVLPKGCDFAAVADRGLDIHITELDVSLSDGATLQQQADVYRQVLEVCLEQPRCTTIQTWGFTDRYSFRSFFDPLLFSRDFDAKLTYTAMQSALGE